MRNLQKMNNVVPMNKTIARTRFVPLLTSPNFPQSPHHCKNTPIPVMSQNKKLFYNNPSTIVTRWNHCSVRFLSNPAHLVSNNANVFKPPTDIKDYFKDPSSQVEYKDKNFSYFVIGLNGVLGAVVARNFVIGYLEHFSASADVLAVAKVEVSLSSIPEGKNAVIKWRGKPIFIRHRTNDEINEANDIDVSSLKDPQKDSERTQDPSWLVMIGVCTHLGCIPVGESGDYGGWFCPCHGSHYDISGRIRKGPAPLNLEIPSYTIEKDNDKIVIG